MEKKTIYQYKVGETILTRTCRRIDESVSFYDYLVKKNYEIILIA